MPKPTSLGLDFAPFVDAVADRVAERLASAVDTPRWRTVAAEAARRGFPSARALRDWCREHGVALRGNGKHQVVGVAELDAAVDRLPAREERKAVRASVDDDAAILASAGLRIVPTRRGR